MGKINLFKSKKQRQREKEREVRRAQTKAEDAAKEIERRIQQMEKEGKKDWDNAVKAKQTGDKFTVDRMLRSFRSRRLLMTKMDQKRWVFEQYLQKILAMQVDGDFSTALSGLIAVVDIDPDQIEDVFEAAREKLHEEKETAHIWEREYWREMGDAESATGEAVPSIESLEKQLEAEAAGAVMVGGEKSAGIDAEISAGLEAVKKLLE